MKRRAELLQKFGGSPRGWGNVETSRGYGGLGQPPRLPVGAWKGAGALGLGLTGRGCQDGVLPGTPSFGGDSWMDRLCPLQPLTLQGKRTGRGFKGITNHSLPPHSGGLTALSPAYLP